MGHRDELNELSMLAGAQVAWLTARVRRVDDDEAVLAIDRVIRGRRDDELESAHIAPSCLVSPLAGDRVAVLRDVSGRHYVTAILEREAPGALSLGSTRAIEITSSTGLRLAAKSIELDAESTMRLRSPLLEAVGERFSACFRSLRALAAEAALDSKFVRICTELIDVVAERIGVHARHSARHIEGVEQLHCRDLDLRAGELAHVRARTVLIKANALAKVDASQIQIG